MRTFSEAYSVLPVLSQQRADQDLQDSPCRDHLQPRRERKTNAREWRYGTHGSLSVNLDKGIWFDHELNEGGGCFDLILQEVPEARENGGVAHWVREQGLEGP